MTSACDLCGSEPHHYVVLNRWAAVSGMRGTMISGPQAYKWVPRTGLCSGVTLCVPGCLTMWVEAQIVEVEARNRTR